MEIKYNFKIENTQLNNIEIKILIDFYIIVYDKTYFIDNSIRNCNQLLS